MLRPLAQIADIYGIGLGSFSGYVSAVEARYHEQDADDKPRRSHIEMISISSDLWLTPISTEPKYTEATASKPPAALPEG